MRVTVKNNKAGDTVVMAKATSVIKVDARIAENDGIIDMLVEQVKEDLRQEIDYGDVEISDVRESAIA